MAIKKKPLFKGVCGSLIHPLSALLIIPHGNYRASGLGVRANQRQKWRGWEWYNDFKNKEITAPKHDILLFDSAKIWNIRFPNHLN